MYDNTIIYDIFLHIANRIKDGEFSEKPKQSDIAEYLEKADGPACRLPLDYNLITYNDFSVQLPSHISAIDDFLAEHEDVFGKAYPARSLGEMLWAAVEWYAYKLADDPEFFDALEKATGLKIKRYTE